MEKKRFESLWREREWDTKERLGEDGETNLQGARSARRRAGEQRVCGPVPKRYTATTERKGTKKRAKDEKDSVKKKGCVTDTVALPFRFKSILRQKKNYENSNISPSKNNIIVQKTKKSSKRNQNPSRYYYNTL
jgi:hypothetical protein